LQQGLWRQAKMANGKRHHVRFTAEKKVPEPVRVSFERKDGTTVNFPAHKKVKEEVDVDFMARNRKK
jgi:hypothetical protein